MFLRGLRDNPLDGDLNEISKKNLIPVGSERLERLSITKGDIYNTEPCQTSTMKCFAKIIFASFSFILDVLQGSEYVFDNANKVYSLYLMQSHTDKPRRIQYLIAFKISSRE